MVRGVETFTDVIDVLSTPSLFKPEGMAVLDTATVLEGLAEPYLFDTVMHEKGGRVTHLEGYGWGKGYKHLYDAMLQVTRACDGLVRKNINVLILCQSSAVTKRHPGGDDYIQDGPKLSHPSTEKHSVRLHFCEWAVHVIKLDYENLNVKIEEGSKKPGKARGRNTRALFVTPEPHFIAKTRSLKEDVISFEDPTDDSLWQILFNKE